MVSTSVRHILHKHSCKCTPFAVVQYIVHEQWQIIWYTDLRKAQNILVSCLDRPLQFSFLELHLQWLKLGDASLFLRDPFLHRIRWFKLELQPGFGSEFVQLCGAGLKTCLSHQSTFTLTDQHAANSSTACSCLSGFPKLTCKAVKQEQQVRQTWQRFIYFCSVRQSRTISLHNGLFSHLRHPLAPEHPKQGSAICAYVSYKEQWVVGQVQLCLPLNQEQYLRWIGRIWRDVFLFVALSSEPTGPFSPIHFHRLLLSFTKPKYRKENGTGRSSNDSSKVLCWDELEMTF